MRTTLAPWQKTALKADLQRRAATLRETTARHLLESEDERSHLLAERVGDAEEKTVADLLLDVDFAEIDREREELREVEGALGRIEQGTYGVCVSCNTPIPFDRLKAYPAARRCHPCQARFETKPPGTTLATR